MDYLDRGFANIRLPNDENSHFYDYSSINNIFPQEVYVHEFLHTMERVSRENGIECPFLHDNAKYGYEPNELEGLRKWYKDFMTKSISSGGEYIGLDARTYSYKPVHSNSFKNSITLELDDNPDNAFEEVQNIIKVIAHTIQRKR